MTILQHKISGARLSVAAILLMGLTACGGGSYSTDDNGSGSYTPPEPAQFFQMNSPTTTALSIGEAFISEQGLSLYTFENDRNDTDGDGFGDSDCNGDCADTWPPLLADSSSMADGQFTLIARDNGDIQWAFKGLPLYQFNTDAEQGDINGEGIKDVWFIARPDPIKIAEANASAIGTIFVGDFSVSATDGAGGLATSRIDRTGFSLYTFENDRNDTDGDGFGDSDCNAGCAETWPPMFADKGSTATGNFSIINRDDGSVQWAYQGLPLYFFVNDAAAGDTNGESINDIWYVARPAPTKLTTSALGDILISTTDISGVDGAGGIDVSTRSRQGFSLYVFDNDANDANADGFGDSDCNAGCAEIWPPLFADNGAVATGNYSLITRDDGSSQWAYNGQALYFFVNDTAAGDLNGDQVNTIWHLARTAPFQVVTDPTLGDIFAARGLISDVTDSGAQAESSTDKTGYTVYFFDDDATDTDGDGAGDSDCNDSCAVTWPPLYADQNDVAGENFTIITRDDGSLQWAYNNQPLYFFTPDTAPGTTAGIYGTWHEVTP